MPTANSSSRWLLWLFVLVPFGAGIFFLARGALLHPFPWKSASWEQTTGTITGVSVVFWGPISPREESGAKGSGFDAKISYQYAVDGKTYAGNDASFPLLEYAREQIDRSEAERRAQRRFPVGATMPAFFDPSEPSQSTLQPGIRNAATIDFFIGGACLLVAGWQMWTLRRKIS